LATVGIAKGSAKPGWIAAATLDRYLQKIKQPQIYGTQYHIGPNQGDKFTQDPYNRPGFSPDGDVRAGSGGTTEGS